MQEFAHAKSPAQVGRVRRLFLEKGPIARQRILLFTIAAVPVFFLRSVNDPINVPKLALLFVGVSVAATIKVMELLQGATVLSLKRAWLPAAAVSLPLFIAWLASPYRGWALLGLYDRFQGLLPYVAVALLAVLVADSFDDRVDRLAWALAASATIVGLYAVIQVVGLDPLQWARADEAVSDAGSTIGNPNFTGGFLAMTIPLFIGLWIERADKRLVIAAMTCAAAAGWVVAFSQGAWIAGAAGVVVTLGVFGADRMSWTRVASFGVAGLVAVAVVGQVLLGVARGGGPFVPGTVLLRAEAWKGAVAMAVDSPLVGRGPNAYAVEGVQHRTLADALRIGYDYPNDPHSVFLAMATAAGILGTLGFLAMLVWIVRRAARVRGGNVWGAAVLGAIVAYLIQSLVSIDELSLRVTFWALLGALALASTRADEVEMAPDGRRSTSRKKRRRNEPLQYPTGVGVIAIVAILLIWLTGRFFMADVSALQGVVHAGSRELTEARSDFERAIELRPEYEYQRLYGLRVGAVALQPPEPNESAIESAKDAFSFLDEFPHVSMLVERARILQAAAIFDESSLEESLASWERARELDPLNPLIAVEMTGVLVQLQRPEDGRAVLEPFSDDVGDRLPQYWGALALVRAQTGDVESANDALTRGLALNPEDSWVREAAIFLESRDRAE